MKYAIYAFVFTVGPLLLIGLVAVFSSVWQWLIDTIFRIGELFQDEAKECYNQAMMGLAQSHAVNLSFEMWLDHYNLNPEAWKIPDFRSKFPYRRIDGRFTSVKFDLPNYRKYYKWYNTVYKAGLIAKAKAKEDAIQRERDLAYFNEVQKDIDARRALAEQERQEAMATYEKVVSSMNEGYVKDLANLQHEQWQCWTNMNQITGRE